MIYKEQEAIFTDIARVCSFGLSRVIYGLFEGREFTIFATGQPTKVEISFS
jgi:hypothetical protein